MWAFQILSLNKEAILDFQNYAQTENEVCGLMVGRRDNYTATVTNIYKITNISQHPEDSFVMDPTEFLDAIMNTEMWDKDDPKLPDFVGIIHSHPKSHAFPSTADWYHAKTNDLLHGGYVIYSPLYDELNAFYWNGHEFKQVGLPNEQ